MSDFRLESFLAQQRWQAFRSLETTETIPPFAPVQLGSSTDPTRAEIDDATGEILLLAGQVFQIAYDFGATAGTVISCDDIAFNGPLEVLPGERGVLTLDTPCIAAIDGTTTGLLVPQSPEISAAGWGLQNTIPTGGEDTCVPSCFRRLGFIAIAGTLYITVQRIRYSAFYQTDKLFT